MGCSEDGTVSVRCFARHGVFCDGTAHPAPDPRSNETTVTCGGTEYSVDAAIFNVSQGCVYLDPAALYSHRVAVALSVFGGIFGLDRFYLGYPGIGLVKLCTCGFLLFGWLVDLILIAAQVVGPADGSAYWMGYYGPRMTGQAYVSLEEYRETAACYRP